MEAKAPTMRDKAVALARMGFAVFPLVPKGKTPLIAKFYEVASSDPATVANMWTGAMATEAMPWNIGISTDKLLVLDVDNKNGKDGNAALQKITADHGLDLNTVVAETPTGGRHYYYKLPEGVDKVPSTAGRFGEGIDTRSYHGFVVAPGSVVEAGEYRWIRAPKEAGGAPLSSEALTCAAAIRKGERT